MNSYSSLKRVFLQCTMTLAVVVYLIPVEAQENSQQLQLTRWSKRIDELINAQQLEAAVLYLENIQTGHFAPNSFATKELLEFNRMKIGILQKETYYLNKAISYLSSSNDAAKKTNVYFLLAHHYFELSMFQEAIDFLESTDQLYLNNDENEQVQFEKAVSYFSQKKFDNAKPYLKSLVQLEKSRYKTDVQYYLGFIAFSENNFTEALPFFQSIEKDDKYKRAIPFYLAYIYHDKGDETKAIEYGESYLKTNNGLHQVEMMQLLASIYFNQDEYSKTVSLYENLITLGLTLTPVQRFELGTGYYHLDRNAKAIEQLKPLSIGKDDIATESMFVLGLSYLQLNDKSNARTSFQYCTSSNLAVDKKEIATYLDAKLSFELGFEDQGFKTVTSFLDNYPNSKYRQEVKEILLQYYTKTNNFKAAIDMLDKVDLSNPFVKNIIPRVYFGRALELMYDVQYDASENMFKLLNAYTQSSYYRLSLFWMGEISFRKNDYGSAVKFFQQYLSSPTITSGDANELNSYYNLGYSFYEMEDYKKATSYFEKVFLIDNDLSDLKVREAVLRAADCYFMDKNYSKAKSLYDRILTSKGFGTDYATFQTSLIEGIKSPTSKIALLKEAVQNFENSPYINLMYMELADTYMAEEEFEQAIPVLKKVISLVDDEDELKPLVILKLGIAYYNLDNADESIRQYKILIKDFPSSPQTAEALENAKLLYVENGRINDYQLFLESAGKSITALEKDSLLYRYIQNAYAVDPSSAVLTTLNGYVQQFPQGIYIANVLALKADVLLKSKSYREAAETYEMIASKGVSSYQEKSLITASKLYFTELKDFEAALRCYQKLSSLSKNPTVLVDAQRGSVKSYYQLSQYSLAVNDAKKFLDYNSISKEDSALSFLLLGYADQVKKEYKSSSEFFDRASSLTKSAIGAEASFQIANNFYLDSSFAEAEKQAIQTIENAGSSERWITKSYILLADLFIVQRDYFNAKATLKSVIEHCTIADLKKEAEIKLKAAETEEKSNKLKK
ncbi:MAG: hypothetical protein RLY11_252 [Bacteroidota bacterium]